MKKLKNKLFYFGAALIYIVLASFVLILSSMYLEPKMKSFFIDRFTAGNLGSDDIIEIVIDDASVREYSWPWSKYMYTELLDYFTTYAKPKVIGLDMLFSTINPMKKDDIDFVNHISKMDNLVAGFAPESSQIDTSKTEFMESFAKKYAVDVDYKAFDAPADYYNTEAIPELYFKASKNLASVMISNDNSGILFSMVNVIRIGDNYYPSLPLRMYLLENNTNKIVIDDNFITVPKTGVKIPHTFVYKGVVETNIKYYENLYARINNRAVKLDYTHNKLPAYLIINSYRNLKAGKPGKYDINPEIFNGKTVFIGGNINGPSADVVKTPKAERHPGVDIQATMYDNLVHNEFLHSASWYVKGLFVLLLALFAFVFVFNFGFIKSLLLIILLDIIYFTVVAVCAANNIIFSFINPVMVQLVTLIFAYSFKFITENRNKEKIKQAMGKYLSQDIMKNVVSNIDDLKLGGKRAVVTVLFSDIRGFTSLSEKMSAEEVSMILNEYFAEMEPIISKYNGVINKFIGDAVMAIFGEPIQDINHPQNAVKCAYEMLKTVEYLREKWLFEGKPKIEIGVGINTGEVFIGNIGTETRMEYTVIGDTVNLASRIESYNKVYKTNLLVSSSTYSYIADIADVIKISEVQIRGKAKKMNIYEVLRIGVDK